MQVMVLKESQIVMLLKKFMKRSKNLQQLSMLPGALNMRTVLTHAQVLMG